MAFFFYTVQPCYIRIWNYSREKSTSKQSHLKLFASGWIIHSLFDKLVPSWSNVKAQRCKVLKNAFVTLVTSLNPFLGLSIHLFAKRLNACATFQLTCAFGRNWLKLRPRAVFFKMQVTQYYQVLSPKTPTSFSNAECMLHRIASGGKYFFFFKCHT